MKVCERCNEIFNNDDLIRCPHDDTKLLQVRNQESLEGVEIDKRFFIKRMLGRGGMGCVYLARQHSMDRDVALKLLPTELTSNPKAVTRFFREARAASKLTHPNTITVFDFGQTNDGYLFIAMEYLAGDTLASVIQRQMRLSPIRAARILVQMAKSLEEAHGLGVIHRDLKPENIMVLQKAGEADFVKVLDFGMARIVGPDSAPTHTGSGVILGTPCYMSPEQAMGEKVDHRSDIYSLGIIGYEMLTGKPPFLSEQPMAILISHIKETPAPINNNHDEQSFCPELVDLIMSCLDKKAQLRPQSARDMREQLSSIKSLSGAVVDSEEYQKISEEMRRIVNAPTEMAISKSGNTYQKEIIKELDALAETGQHPSSQRPAIKNGIAETQSQMEKSSSRRRRSMAIFLLLAVGLVSYLVIISMQDHSTQQIPATQPNAAASVIAPIHVAEPIGAPVLPKPHGISINTLPQGAQIEIDGKVQGVTPFVLTAPPGAEQLRLKVSKKGHETRMLLIESTQTSELWCPLRRTNIVSSMGQMKRKPQEKMDKITARRPKKQTDGFKRF